MIILIKNNTASPVFLADSGLYFEVPVAGIDLTGFIGIETLSGSAIFAGLCAAGTLTLNIDGNDIPGGNITEVLTPSPVASIVYGLLINRPAYGSGNKLYFATDNGILYFD